MRSAKDDDERVIKQMRMLLAANERTAADQRQRRNEAIVRLLRDGKSKVYVADLAGISDVMVAKIAREAGLAPKLVR